MKPRDERSIYCTNCGHFLGLEAVTVGYIKLKCKSCKLWTTVLGDKGWEGLTETNDRGRLELRTKDQ